MTSQRRSSKIASVVALTLLVLAVHFVVQVAFVSGPVERARRSTHTQTRVSIFDGLPELSFDFGGGKERADEPLSARTAQNVNGRVVEVNLPLGITFEEREAGNIYIKAVDPSSDAYKKGVRPGAQLVMVSAVFGDELWTTRNVGMTQVQTVIQSRFGQTIELALENEDQNIVSSFLSSILPKPDTRSEAERKAKNQNLQQQFEAAEAKLQEKGKINWPWER